MVLARITLLVAVFTPLLFLTGFGGRLDDDLSQLISAHDPITLTILGALAGNLLWQLGKKR